MPSASSRLSLTWGCGPVRSSTRPDWTAGPRTGPCSRKVGTGRGLATGSRANHARTARLAPEAGSGSRTSRQTGAKALARSANREAVSCFGAALTALGRLPETRETWEQAPSIFASTLETRSTSRVPELKRLSAETEALARRLNDQMRLGWVSVYMCSSRDSWQSRHQGATSRRGSSHCGDARRCAAPDRSPVLPVFVCHASGDYRGTEHVSRRLTQLLEGNRIRERFRLAVFPAVWSRAFLARGLAERGVFDEGDAQGQEAVRIAEAVDHQFSVIFACLGLAYVNSVGEN